MSAQSEKELSVFESFTSVAKLDVNKGTVESRDPPEPDLRCQVSGEHRAFELTEVVDPVRNRRRAVMLRGVEGFSDLVAELPPDHPLKTKFSDAGFQVTFEDSATDTACKKARTPLIEHLGQDHAILRLGNKEYVQLPSTKLLKAVKHVSVIRGYPNGPSVSASGGGAVSIPVIESVKTKFAKSYKTDAGIDLLVYFDTYRALDEARWLHELRELVDRNLDRSPFDRLWVYDRKDERLIWSS